MRWYIRYMMEGRYVLHTSYSEAEHEAAYRSFFELGFIDHHSHIWSE